FIFYCLMRPPVSTLFPTRRSSDLIAATAGLADRFAYSMSKGAVLSMTLSVARDYLAHKIRCNCISPARVHTAFVDGYLKRNYPGDRKSTRLNSSHGSISYAVFCLK